MKDRETDITRHRDRDHREMALTDILLSLSIFQEVKIKRKANNIYGGTFLPGGERGGMAAVKKVMMGTAGAVDLHVTSTAG